MAAIMASIEAVTVGGNMQRGCQVPVRVLRGHRKK
jgi:hypothetical protein